MQIKGLNKSYQGKQVLHDINLDIPEHQVISLIGPNGAGKSTLLNILARLQKADSGKVVLYNQEISNYQSNILAQKLAILTQSNNIQSKITLRDLISFGRFPYSKGKLTKDDHLMVDQAIDYLDLKEFEQCFLDELSGGQRQRALIAMTLAQDTNYILLDEPTNNLDIYHANKLMKTVRQLCDDLGKTIIMVLHDLNYASFYSDYIAVMVKGVIAKFGAVHDIIQADFLKTVYKVNFKIETVNHKPLCIHY